jgi:hypothetical protein
MWERVRSSDIVIVSVRQSQYELMERRSIVTTEAEESGRGCADATRVGK